MGGPRHSVGTRAIRPKARDFIAQTWQSQASLSLFLVLLVISIFVPPAMGGQRVDIKLASDIVRLLMLIAGVAVAWGRRGLPPIGIAVAIPTLIFRSGAWASPVASVWHGMTGGLPRQFWLLVTSSWRRFFVQARLALCEFKARWRHTFCWELPMHTVIKSRNTLMPPQSPAQKAQ